MIRLSSVLVVSLFFWWIPLYADQNSPELDDLFVQLHETIDPEVGGTISKEIWRYWYKSDNEDIDQLMRLGETSMAQSRYKEAAAYFSEIIQIAPGFAEGWNRRATAYYLMGEFKLSTEDVKQTLKLEPRHFGALSGQGMIYLRLEKIELAIEYMKRALAVNPHMLGIRETIQDLEKMLQEEVI